MPIEGSQFPPTGAFCATRWTLVRRARGESPEARAALSELGEAYWTPVFHFLRREGRDEDAARELTQEFFARLFARGLGQIEPGRARFRSFLLGAVKHFLADVRDHDRRLKRGGGQEPEPLDAGPPGDTAAGLRVADSRAEVPDTFFDREWALNVMDRGLRTLAQEFADAAKAEQFEVLKPWLAGEGQTLSQAEAARALGWTEGAVKVAVHRMRKRFRELIRAEVVQTVPDSADVDSELRYLVEVLTKAQ
jgi:RNA polymerase sigma factor (sigma-70 family)